VEAVADKYEKEAAVDKRMEVADEQIEACM
jgi:hypothetical protein